MQHPSDAIELIFVDKAAEEEVGRELNRDFAYVLRRTFVLFPYVLQFLAGYQHQVIVADNLGRVAHDTFHSGRMFGEVQFKLRMTMDRVCKLCLLSIGYIETIPIGQRSNLPHNRILIFHDIKR